MSTLHLPAGSYNEMKIYNVCNHVATCTNASVHHVLNVCRWTWVWPKMHVALEAPLIDTSAI